MTQAILLANERSSEPQATRLREENARKRERVERRRSRRARMREADERHERNERIVLLSAFAGAFLFYALCVAPQFLMDVAQW